MVIEMADLRNWVTKNLKKYNINLMLQRLNSYVFQEFLVTYLIL